MFYNYLRNDDFYKNTRERSSDVEGEKYITKGESDPKKLFLVIWLIVILILTSVSLWLYSINTILYARVPERPKGEDLRSSGIGLRGFESLPLHYFIFIFSIML